MKLRSLVTLLAITLLSLAGAVAQSNPQSLQFNANQYNVWHGYVITGVSATGAGTITVVTTGLYSPPRTQAKNPLGGFAIVPVTVDSETETPTSITCNVAPPQGSPENVNPALVCNVTATWSAIHGVGANIQSGDQGVQEAINDAQANGGGVVVIDNSSLVTNAMLTSAIPSPTVVIEDGRGGMPVYWGAQPTTLTTISAPTVLNANTTCTPGTTTVCNNASTGGTWANSTYHFCVTYVDMLGGESPCSSDASFTSTGTTSTVQFTSPAASTGAVGYRVYGGLTYAAAYLLPISSSVCPLTTLETVFPACALGAPAVSLGPVTNSNLRPGYTANTFDPVPQSHTTFAYAPSSVTGSAGGFQANYGPFPATGAIAATQPSVLGSIQLPAGYLGYIGRTIRVYGKITLNTVVSTATPSITVALGSAGTNGFTTGTPINVCTMTGTGALAGASYNAYFTCTMTVNAAGTSGTVMPDSFAAFQVSAGTTTAADVLVESATAAITANMALQQTLFVDITFGTAGVTTSATLSDLHIESL